MLKKNKGCTSFSLFEEFGFGAASLMDEIRNNKQNKGGFGRGIMLWTVFILFYTITLILGLFHIICRICRKN